MSGEEKSMFADHYGHWSATALWLRTRSTQRSLESAFSRPALIEMLAPGKMMTLDKGESQSQVKAALINRLSC